MGELAEYIPHRHCGGGNTTVYVWQKASKSISLCVDLAGVLGAVAAQSHLGWEVRESDLTHNLLNQDLAGGNARGAVMCLLTSSPGNGTGGTVCSVWFGARVSGSGQDSKLLSWVQT